MRAIFIGEASVLAMASANAPRTVWENCILLREGGLWRLAVTEIGGGMDVLSGEIGILTRETLSGFISHAMVLSSS